VRSGVECSEVTSVFIVKKTTKKKFSSGVFIVKVPIQLESLTLAAKNNLCYWMSNKSRIKSDFPNYNRLPNLPIIKESQIQIYVYLYAYLFIYAFIPSAGVIYGFVLIKIVRT
jgi:hypothetical protein